MKPRILIVEDEKSLLVSTKDELEDEGYEVYSAQNGRDAVEMCEKMEFDVCILDMRLPGMSGEEVFERIKYTQNDIKIIVVTAYGSIEQAVMMMKKGAFYYLSKPYNIDELKIIVKRALETIHLERTVRKLTSLTEDKISPPIIGESKAMKNILSMIEILEDTFSNVLITGETGTGKEVVARAIHNKRFKRESPFVVVNCAAIPETLIESELFGYEKGAFTGATNAKKGKIELAEGGTLFLDEVADLPLPSQARFLRVIEEKKLERLGGLVKRDVNFKLICATNKNIEQMVREGTFRKDLFFRINVVHIHLPPLRERKEDIPLLIKHFIRYFSREMNKKEPEISGEAMELLLSHHYDGNVRELKNIIEHAVMLAENKIKVEHLPLYIRRDRRENGPAECGLNDKKLKEMVFEYEKNCILDAWRKCGGSVGKTAQMLGISRKTLWKKAKRYSLSLKR